MRQANIARYFKLLLGTDYDSSEMIKGEAHFKVIQRELSITPVEFSKTTVMVGDGPYDVIIAKQAGLFSIAKAAPENSQRMKNLGADVIIHDLPELLDILSRPLNRQRVFTPLSQVISSKEQR
jgi:phosphoglycolate phosphatase-like HAD superfamily hydrolase